jgi:hypothetical protein
LVATVPPTVRLTAEAFGRDRVGLMFGWIFCGHQLGAATAAFGAGVIRAGFGDYVGAFRLLSSLLVLGRGRERERAPVTAPAA